MSPMYPSRHSDYILPLLSKRELIELLDLVHATAVVTTEPEVTALFLRIRDFVPYQHIIAGLGRMDHLNSFQEFTKIVNVSYPLKWVSAYLEKNFQKVDPIHRLHIKTSRLQKWSETFRKAKTIPEKEFIESAGAFGLVEGFTLGIAHPRNRIKSFFSFAGLSTQKDNRNRAILEYLTPHLHQTLWRIASLSSDIGGAGFAISLREREVLNWIKEGKTSWEISKILQISERTVNFHVHNILSKLQATSRGHALAIAMEQKIIAL
jgi:LuxR family transcriptional regulator, quorum-sensing system regulator CviR